jgi:bifunctional non-homologous end joining protein LigD
LPDAAPPPKRAAIGVKAPFPGFIEPALASRIEKVPNGERWIHEVKFDGYRVQIQIANAAVKVFTRRGNDWTNRFKKIASHAWHLNVKSAIIDGEVVVPVLQHELRGIWVEPSLLAEIEYRATSAEGKLRHPFFKGIREDL